ncbi:MAG: zinc ribbon domain-containing protein [Burkholderiales bacterium]
MSNTTPSTPIGGVSPDAFSSMFQAINGLRNHRALIAMAGCMFVGVLVFGFFSFLAARMGFFLGFLGGLGLFIASATGINASGVLLMDQAKGQPSRELGDAIAYGLLCIPKFILLGLALFAVSLVVFVAIAIVFFICKIPVLGPILFVVVFPLSVVIAGLTLCGLFLCMFLALPAIWEGATISRAIAQALAIARSRLIESILLMAVVGVLSAVVGFIVFGVLFAGLAPTLGMSASILGGDALGGLMGMMRQGGDYGDMGGGFGGGRGARAAGYVVAAGIGAGLLWALAGSLLALVNLLGLNLVYLRVTEGLDVGASEAALKASLDHARRQAADLAQKAKDAADRAREPAAAATAPATSATPPQQPHAPPAFAPAPRSAAATREPPADSTIPAMGKSLACPQCLTAVSRDDAFCGVCGHKLK